MFEKLLLITVFLTAAYTHYGQSSAWQLNGSVINDAGELLAGATVFINDTIPLVTDDQGRFSYSYHRKLPIDVVARYVGCFPRRVVLTEADFVNRTVNLQIVLNVDGHQLQEVNIEAARIKQIIEEDFTTDIFDFEFIDGKVLLLMRVKKKYYLRLTSESGRQFDQIQLPYPAKRLFRSCLNGLHVVGDNYAQEITLKSREALDTLPRYSRNQFDRFLEPCAAQSKGFFYFKKAGFMNQSVRYDYIDPFGEWNQLAYIANNAGIAEAESALDDFFSGKPMMIARAWGESSIDEDIGHVKQQSNNYSTEQLLKRANTNSQIAHLGNIERIKMDSVYAPLIKSGDTLFLFDHVKGSLFQLKAPVQQICTIPIDYQSEKGWQTELFYDRQAHRFYALFWNEGKYTLKRINTATGKTDMSYPLEEMPLWSKKIKIYNGYLYYLGQEDANVPNYALKKIDFQRRTSQN